MSIAMSTSGGGFPPAGITPAAVQQEVINALLGGAPFARSLTRRNLSANSTVWPIVEPTGANWVLEAQPLPVVTLGDRSYSVTPTKLAGLFSLSSELVDDSSFGITQALGDAVKDSMGPKLDDGLLNGNGTPPNPQGVYEIAPAVDGASLRAAISLAVAEIGEDGGAADTVALSPTDAAAEASREGSDGHPIYPEGMTSLYGLKVVPVPGLTQSLVYDSTRVLCVVRDDFSVEASADAGFTTDTIAVRVKGRFAVAVPVVNKGIRKITVAGSPAATSERRTTATKGSSKG
jgi:HK97 family phage major capsid protein